MKISSISEVKKELNVLPKEELIELLNKLSKHSMDNKEFLHYLLFEIDFEENYISKIKEEIDVEFNLIKGRTWKSIKKSIQRILKIIKKHIKYSKKPETEIELLMYFCKKLSAFKSIFKNNPVILNIYIRQITAINKALNKLHEDIQYDYKVEIEEATEILL